MKRGETTGVRVWVLAGEEFQRSERLAEILEATVERATRDFNLDIFTPETISQESFSSLLLTFPMMAERRVIVLRDFDTFRPEIRKKVSGAVRDTPDTTLVIVEGEKASLSPKPPAKMLRVESFKPIYENRLPPWVQARFSRRGKRVQREAVALLINNMGTVLRELDSEIEKITVAVGDREQVTGEDVSRIVGAFRRDTVWNFQNAVGLGDFDTAARILTSLLESEKNRESYYIGSLATHIVKVADFNSRVKNGVPRAEAMKSVVANSWFWQLNRMDEQSRRITPSVARRILEILAETDSKMKRYTLNRRLMMELALPLLVGERKA
ncbi:MAG: DNA polymerase III subunit delta [Candidatus Latescibacteria bacterium]|nr:DNA polymerase III subunit delta [Candidatus Latescibacterota bacterium]